RASDSKIYNNTIYDAFGILARFPATGPSDIRNNIISGAVAARGDASIVARNNLEAGWAIGDYIPAASRALTLRLFDYGERWPLIFSPARITWATRTIEDFAVWLGRSSFGRGSVAFNDWFTDPRTSDFGRRDVARILKKGEPIPEVETDFCGQKRG